MALPPRVLYLLCVGDNSEMYETLKINNCLSPDALSNKKGFLQNFENFNKKLLEEYLKEEITGGWKKPMVGLNGFDEKIRLLEGTGYLNDYAFTLNEMNYHDYELCSKCRKIFLKSKSEFQCFQCSQPLVGWLVIVDGKGKGHDLQIFEGQNSIGRDKSNMVCIDLHSVLDPHDVVFTISSYAGGIITATDGRQFRLNGETLQFNQINHGPNSVEKLPLLINNKQVIKLAK